MRKIAVRLRIMAFTVTGRTAVFLLLCGSTDRGAFSGKSQMFRNNESFGAGN